MRGEGGGSRWSARTWLLAKLLKKAADVLKEVAGNAIPSALAVIVTAKTAGAAALGWCAAGGGAGAKVTAPPRGSFVALSEGSAALEACASLRRDVVPIAAAPAASAARRAARILAPGEQTKPRQALRARVGPAAGASRLARRVRTLSRATEECECRSHVEVRKASRAR